MTNLTTARSRASVSSTSNSPSQNAHQCDSTQADWWSDRWSILLLVALYAVQGMPMGLVFGSVPFLLKDAATSYADLALFSFASMPYSVKLLIAPVVDSVYSVRVGRRKSWIVPAQLVSGSLLLLLADAIASWVRSGNVRLLMPTFFVVLATAAIQDIAVDGWSLTMLQKRNVSYASTCQSLGLSLGYFSTFTIFLAFNSAEFCNKFLRPYLPASTVPAQGPVIGLADALRLVGIAYLSLTTVILFLKHEVSADEDAKKCDRALPSYSAKQQESNAHGEDSGATLLHSPLLSKEDFTWARVTRTYADVIRVVRLPAVRSLVIILLIAKTGFSAYDNVAPLKMLDLGFPKETMASMAVVQAPFALFGTVLTGRWAAKASPLTPYMWGYLLRFLASLTGPPLMHMFARMGGVVTPQFYGLVLTLSIVYSFASECLMFVGMGAFFLNVTSSSVSIAGSFLTLLNTASNLGGMWHRAITLYLVDVLTLREACDLLKDAAPGAQCPVRVDGYYVLSMVLVPVALLNGLYLRKTLPSLANLRESAWTVDRR